MFGRRSAFVRWNGDSTISVLIYDGLGCAIETRQYETAPAYIRTLQAYDALGRVQGVSNPLRLGNPVWTTTAYDALGRVIKVTTPDGAATSMEYLGDKSTTKDPALKKRSNRTDALGRLTRVEEDGNSNLATIYSYNPLDNLTGVTQGVQVRSFVYDGLSRLLSAANPESGTTQL